MKVKKERPNKNQINNNLLKDFNSSLIIMGHVFVLDCK